MGIDIYKYDTSLYDFRSLVIEALEINNLEELHKKENGNSSNGDNIQWDKKFYENNFKFNNLYLEFIKNFIKPLFNDETIVYQKQPEIQFYLSGDTNSSQFHKDSDYEYPPNQINFWIPFVDTFSTNTIWIESDIGTNNFCPKGINYGEILKFDGFNFRYGNKVNDTGISTSSICFRVVKYSDFVDANVKFNIGDYFDVI